MSSTDASVGSSDTRRPLEGADLQLALYARDLKRVVDSERQKARELEAANARLKILDRLKMDFLQFISHELRTPLSIMSMVEVFDPVADPAEQADLTAIVKGAYERLDNLIRKGLQYFHWMSVERVLDPGLSDLEEVTRGVAAASPGLRAPGVDFQIASSGASPVPVGEDDLREVITVLVDNALKFSLGDKFIRMEVSSRDGWATLTVSDHGVGFAPELAREILRPFTVADVAHHTGGSGLNLALAGAIVSAHGGSIEAHSAGSGRGATFTVSLPLAVARTSAT